MFKKAIGNGIKGAFTLAEGATHTKMFGKARKSAFTLAEVLITLGIIGVVAAMTMPTLINSTQGAQYKTAYKKALSVMSQAVVMNIALEDYDLSQTIDGRNGGAAAHGEKKPTTEEGTGGVAAEAQTLYTLFKNRMNVVKVAAASDFSSETPGDAKAYLIADVGDPTDFIGAHDGNAKIITDLQALNGGEKGASIKGLDATMLFFNDGITFIFDNSQAGCTAGSATMLPHYCFGWIDVNGQKGPNNVVQCDDGTLDDKVTNKDETTCTVSNPTDIYPIAMFDQSIIPASAAARAVLYAK